MLQPGQILGEFEILGQLGQGGMGAVFKARQTVLRRVVAVKALQSSFAADPDFVARFHNEAVAAAALNHPNLVQVYSAGCTQDIHWFAMEYVDGETIQTRLKRLGKLDPSEAIAICMHVATALDFGWRKALLIHRDIKPDNIFLSQDGEVKLGDLGLAKSSDQQHGLTVTGASMGTPLYISPEQAEGRSSIDLRTDIYSLGATLFHLLAGTPPYRGESAVSVLLKHVTAPVPNLEDIDPTLPPAIGLVVSKMMQKDPAHRYGSYAELNADLRSVYDALLAGPEAAGAVLPSAPRNTESSEIPARDSTGDMHEFRSPAAGGRFPRWLLPTAAGVVVLGAVGAGFFTLRKSDAIPRAESSQEIDSVNDLIEGLEAKLLQVPGENILLSRTEFTVGEWKLYCAATKRSVWKTPADFSQTDEHPVVGVSLNDAREFCKWLSDESGETWRLPKEREWEAAAGTAIFPWGENFPPGKENGNYALSADGQPDPNRIGIDGFFGTAPVRSFKANPLGFFDMGGNVTEWMEDGVLEGKPVVRGGCWMDLPKGPVDPEYFKTRYRRSVGGGSATDARGFRIAKVQDSNREGALSEKSVLHQPSGAGYTATDLVKHFESKLLSVPGTGVRMSKTEVTAGEWATYRSLAGLPEWDSPRERLRKIRIKGLPYAGIKVWKHTRDQPASWVEWEDARDFCLWLSKASGMEWRLPLNSEWDAAACPDGRWESLSTNGAHFSQKGASGPASVASFRANPLGFYDLIGNVWEWVQDADPKSKDHILRGGGWRVPSNLVTPAFLSERHKTNSDQVRHRGGADVGFRVVQVQSTGGH